MEIFNENTLFFIKQGFNFLLILEKKDGKR